jgi:2-polyprenyl-3-methyl-5-hydroxy-6-metoxy-1,4-benzoquinol methylase
LTFLDTFIQQQRINKALPHIPPACVLLDIGCHRGELFKALGNKLVHGTGVDPLLSTDIHTNRYSLLKGFFPYVPKQPLEYDCITMLAVLEHIPISHQPVIAKQCHQLLKNNGKLIITVPSPKTDGLLKLLTGLRLIKGMSLEEHYGFDIKTVIPLFTQAGLTLLKHQPFQWGFNNLFIFQKLYQNSNA